MSWDDVCMNMFAKESLRTAEVEENRRVTVDHERHLGCFLVLVFSCAVTLSNDMQTSSSVHDSYHKASCCDGDSIFSMYVNVSAHPIF